MRAFTLRSIVLSTICAVASACGSSTTTNVAAPTSNASRCQASLDNSTKTFGADGGASSVAVTTPRECSWTASPDASWVAITSGGQGQGDGTIAFRVDPNSDPVLRRSGITVGDAHLALEQQAGPCRFDIAMPQDPIAAAGGSIRADVRTHESCSWSAASSVPWATAAPASGRGNGTVQVSVAANAGSARSGVITIAGTGIPVSQAAPQAPPEPPRPPDPPRPPEDPPQPPTDITVSGRVASLSGSCPTVQFVVAPYIVITDRETRFKKGSCRDLKNSQKVKVKGKTQGDGKVYASEVELND